MYAPLAFVSTYAPLTFVSTYAPLTFVSTYAPLTFVSVGLVLVLLAGLGAGAGFAGGAVALALAATRRYGSARRTASDRRSVDAPPDVPSAARALGALVLAVVVAAVFVPTVVAMTGFRFLMPIFGVPTLSGAAAGALTVYVVAVRPTSGSGSGWRS